MKGSLKWLVLYNAYFPLNHPTLFEKCLKLQKEGRLTIKKYKEIIKNNEQMKELMDNLDNPEDIVAGSHADELFELPLSQGLKRMRKSPKKYLTSVTSIWYFPPWNKITRIDCGEPELKYLIKAEEKFPKFKGEN